jgi:hypothetical protein
LVYTELQAQQSTQSKPVFIYCKSGEEVKAAENSNNQA